MRGVVVSKKMKGGPGEQKCKCKKPEASLIQYNVGPNFGSCNSFLGEIKLEQEPCVDEWLQRFDTPT